MTSMGEAKRRQEAWGGQRDTAKTVIIGVPSFADGRADFWNSLEALRLQAARDGFTTIKVLRRGCYIEHARNLIVNDALTKFPHASHIMWLDDDMVFEPDVLRRLWRHGLDIVVGNYHRKQSPYLPVVSVLEDNILMPAYIRPADDAPIHRISAAGTGICLTRVEVFKRIPFPWFKNEYSAPMPNTKPTEMINGQVLIGEDTYFFMKAQGCGIKVYCDFSIEAMHIGNHPFGWKDFEAYERNQSHNQG